MGLNKQKGNMYPFVTHTWNPIRGKCPHDCSYCYMKAYPQPEIYFAEKELKTNLGHTNFIFVGSSTDMWAKAIARAWIARVLKYCCDNDAYNHYLFQSKNPARFLEWLSFYPDSTILGTTIETNRDYQISKAPNILERFAAMCELKNVGFPLILSLEPIMDFDLDAMVEMVELLKPEFVSIGADSKRHNLPEPSPDKIQSLIEALRSIIKVKLKDNLRRIGVFNLNES